MTLLPAVDRLYRLAPTGPAGPHLTTAGSGWQRLRRLRLTWLGGVCALAVLLAAATVSVISVDADFSGALVDLLAAVGQVLARLRWQFVAIVLGLALLHYVVTAIAARCASGLPVPLTEAVLVQFAAAAANRITPAGLGGAAVTARYLGRRGLTPSAAIGAMVLLGVLGPITDVLVLALVVLAGRWFGLGGATHELGLLTAKLVRLASLIRSPWVLLAGAAAISLAVLLRGRGGDLLSVRGLLLPARRIARNPRGLAGLILASGSTTLILALAFVCSIAMVPGPHPSVGAGAIVVAFMLGSAAGSAVPIPAGLGSTEAALIAVLVSVGMPSGSAVVEVLVFRLLTFWLPAVIGVLATRQLRRSAAL